MRLKKYMPIIYLYLACVCALLLVLHYTTEPGSNHGMHAESRFVSCVHSNRGGNVSNVDCARYKHKSGGGAKDEKTFLTNSSVDAQVGSRKQLQVPRVVHVLWLYSNVTKLRFHQVVSLMSVQQHIRPDRILLWHTSRPGGPWWPFLLRVCPSLLALKLPSGPPTSIYGHSVTKPEHQADIIRIQLLLQYGGIYLDLDVIVLKSFDSLLHHDVTMGAETPNLLGSGVILAKRNSTFLRIWLDKYKQFDDSRWNYLSGVVPMELARIRPDLIHIEWFSLNRPNWDERTWLYTEGKLWDWSENLAVHLWYREHGVEYDPASIRALNTTMGELFRYVYYGNSSILPRDDTQQTR